MAIVAGSKVSTKLTILQALAAKVDQLIVGGGIANTFMLAQGLPIGKSLAEPTWWTEAQAVIEADEGARRRVPMPVDVVAAKAFAADAPATVKARHRGRRRRPDPGHRPADRAALAQISRRPAPSSGTARWACSSSTPSPRARSDGPRDRRIAAFSIAGGGDTLAAIAKYGIENEVGYISTGGGAFLEVLEGKTLPAIEILQQRAGHVEDVSIHAWRSNSPVRNVHAAPPKIVATLGPASERCPAPWSR